MKAIMVMYDSLNRHYLPNYGCDLSKMTNFRRLGEKTVTFDNSFVGSLPCMPARRDIHTGRLNFLHRGWSPLEPYDDSMPELLKNRNVYTHLVSDHAHYWEDGGCTYHTRYSSWEAIRGQEGDPWKGSLATNECKVSFGEGNVKNEVVNNMKRQDTVNRSYMKEEADFPQAKTFAAGLEFIENNKNYDNWFVQIETFDPHEPFFTPDKYQELYRESTEGEFLLDWPPYGPVRESEEIVKGVRKKYYALLSMCDNYLGKVLDIMDENNMWDDTMLIVNTDHGFFLGEHLWWAKAVMPTYNELAHTPLFIWDPRSKKKNERRNALVQTIDLAPTLLDFFNVDIPDDMLGYPLKDTIDYDKAVRAYALYGYHGSHINITDGEFVYMRAPITEKNQPLYEYTLMPTLMRTRMSPKALANLSLHDPFEFTKGCKTLKIPAQLRHGGSCYRFGTKLYDMINDPGQECTVDDPDKEIEMINAMIALMKINDTPIEQFERMGLPTNEPMTRDLLFKQREESKDFYHNPFMKEYEWDEDALWGFKSLIQLMDKDINEEKFANELVIKMKEKEMKKVNLNILYELVYQIIPKEKQEGVFYTLSFLSRTN